MIVLARSMHPKEVQHLDGHTSIQLTVDLLLALDAEYEQDTPTAWTRPWANDGAHRRVQSFAGTVHVPIQVTAAVKHSRYCISIQHHNM